MLNLSGETHGEYFHVECASCGEHVRLSDLSWEGGVPTLQASCDGCGESASFKLNPTAWSEAVSPDDWQ